MIWIQTIIKQFSCYQNKFYTKFEDSSHSQDPSLANRRIQNSIWNNSFSFAVRELRYTVGFQHADVPKFEELVEIVRGAPHFLQTAQSKATTASVSAGPEQPIHVLRSYRVPNCRGWKASGACRKDFYQVNIFLKNPPLNPGNLL